MTKFGQDVKIVIDGYIFIFSKNLTIYQNHVDCEDKKGLVKNFAKLFDEKGDDLVYICPMCNLKNK